VFVHVQRNMRKRCRSILNAAITCKTLRDGASLCVLAAAILSCDDAAAQVSGTVSLVSRYVYRGNLVNETRPTPQLSLDYDSPDGWYAGVFLSPVRLSGEHDNLQLIGFGGYSGKLAQRWRWEAGLQRSTTRQGTRLDFNEVYVGVSGTDFSSRLFYSPNYAHTGLQTLYGEVSGRHRLTERNSVFAQAGRWHAFARAGYWPAPTDRNDFRLGLSDIHGNLDLQVAWTASRWRAVGGAMQQRHAIVISGTFAF
jgi:uncharacterized protein (TIGR02001 family)